MEIWYYVNKIPQYTWTSTNSNIASTGPNVNDPFKGFMKGEGNWEQVTSITVEDKANNLKKSVVAILNVDKTIFAFVDSLNKHFYYISKIKEEWEVAETICELNGGHLATITSEEENNVCLLCAKRVNDSALIGFTDKEEEGNWTTWEVTGEPVGYTNWAGGQPDDALHNEHYGTIQTGGTWNDARGAFYFILEIDF